MINKLHFKSLLVVVLLGCFNDAFKVIAEENTELAPEVTAGEAATSFWDLPYLEKAYIDTTPLDKKDSLVVGELGVDGGNKDAVIKFAHEIADDKLGDYDSMLISHKGKLVFESYYRRGRIDLPHGQASATKSYTSLILGRAIQLGYLNMADLDKPLTRFLKELEPTKFVTGVEKITLDKALNMRSGIRISEEQREELEKNPSVLKGQGLAQAYFELSAPIESQSYLYRWDQDLVMQVIEAVVPDGAEGFIKNELLNKMGITNYQWQLGVSGLPEAGAGSRMTSRDMLKWGSLVMNNGKWDGEQLIPAEFIAKATSGITRATAEWQPETYCYGYFWYQTMFTVDDKSYEAKLAWGGGGQHILVLPALDLIVVITGHDREDTIMEHVSKRVIPAFVE